MRKILPLLTVAFFFATLPGRAELLEVELSIYGMD